MLNQPIQKQFGLLAWVLFMLFGSGLQAQQELGLYFTRDIWQANRVNPAFITDHELHIGIPNIYYNASLDQLSYDKVVVTQSDGDRGLDMTTLINRLDENNHLLANVELEAFSASFGINNLRISVHMAGKFSSFIDYPKDLIEVGWNGNAQFIGETVDIAPDLHFFAYNELGVGVATKIAGVSVGARLKLLGGIADISTDRTSATLYTDPDIYQLTLNTNYRINSSAVLVYNGDGDFEIDLDELTVDGFFSGNPGVAIDLGASMEFGKLEVSASLVDLGFIHWKRNVRNYLSLNDQTYEGLDFSAIVRSDEIDFEETLDSLRNIFDFKESNNSYRTGLPGKIYIGANYQFNDMVQFGGLFYSEVYRGQIFPAFALSGRARFSRIFSMGAVYAIRNQTYTNLGINMVLRLGPVQIFGVTDNIVAAFQPFDSHNVNARIGLNLAFR